MFRLLHVLAQFFFTTSKSELDYYHPKVTVRDVERLKVGLSTSKKVFFICFNNSPSKMMKNAFYFILKALFVLKVFTFLS